MGVIVTFDLAQWRALFPEFSNVTDQQLQGPVWTMAQAYCRNDGGGPVNDVLVQTELLNLMVAHIAQLLYGSTTSPSTGLAGPVASATEGSVSVSVGIVVNTSNQWFMSTKYGAMFWQMALPYRLARYYPKITELFQPVSQSSWGV
ncbi:DUF4054 domain-containing protein [Mesorhizobium amorphae]|uniref:DUF4054 domain-containing protein n=1 Tax=Mesorhizobium amorphae TaxID=71433 RepID=UPI001185F01A|nr:DUF4054 domain-containing protein [Mesorhizobium amorphae]